MITSLPDASRRSVVTGIGVVAPNGIGTDAWWKASGDAGSGIQRSAGTRSPNHFSRDPSWMTPT